MPSAKNLYHVYHNKLVKQSHSWEMTRLNIAPILETHSIPQRYENKLFSSSRLTELATSETDLYNSTTSSLMFLCWICCVYVLEQVLDTGSVITGNFKWRVYTEIHDGKRLLRDKKQKACFPRIYKRQKQHFRLRGIRKHIYSSLWISAIIHSCSTLRFFWHSLYTTFEVKY